MSHDLNRRKFFSTSVAAAAATAAWTQADSGGSAAKAQEYYELRTYQLQSAAKQKAFLTYVESALLPALNRIGLQRIGVFTSLDKADDHDVRMLIPFPNLQAFDSLTTKLEADAEYQKAAAPHYAMTLKDPAYTRIRSQFMRAFASIPKIELPPQTASNKPRIFELRTYESHNEDTARRKVMMFDKGETQLMRDVQLGPVFFGETLVADDVPNLTYMLSADNDKAHKAHWKAFLAHPEWERIKVLPRFKDTVSKITSVMLKPTGFSEI